MIVRKLPNGKVVHIELGYNQEQEEEFIQMNPTGGFMKVDSLPYSSNYPEYSNYKWQNDAIVIDDAENEKQYISDKVQEYKNYLAATDYKMTADYDKDITEVKELRQEAREYIRLNSGVTNGN